jgi:ribosome biogenesis GTPase / thiamine phosphate phosphatase
MSKEEKKMRKHIEAHQGREVRKALSKARTKVSKPPRDRMDVRSAEFEADNPPPPKTNRAAANRAATVRESVAPVSRGFVVETGPGFCDVISNGERIRCRFTGEVAIGDQVTFSPDRRRIEDILPRRTVLSRTDPHNPRIQRVIAANVDIVVNVVSLKTPPLHPGLIDRYLIAIGKSGAAPLICVNKVDLQASPEELDPMRPYQDVGIPVLFCSAATGVGLAELLDALAGKLCVFAGHSGVGKSSLLNALNPQLEIATGSVSSANEKGRHTTTSSALYRLPNGATVIDTPGIREFGLWDVSKDDLRNYYQEFASHSCAFSDCTHTHEPDCGVKQAVATGAIPKPRYESYARIRALLET